MHCTDFQYAYATISDNFMCEISRTFSVKYYIKSPKSPYKILSSDISINDKKMIVKS